LKNVIVLGTGRSGTSMVAGCLARSGYFMGDRLLPADENNLTGYFEDVGMNALNEDILEGMVPRRPRLLGNMFFRHRPLRYQRWLAAVPTARTVEPSPRWTDRMRRFVERQPYCFKDPRFCYTLPAWRPVLGTARFVCVFRHPATTAASMMKVWQTDHRLRTLSLTFERALGVWEAMYSHVLEKHRREGTWLFTHYECLFERAGLERLGAFLECDVDVAFPDRKLNRTMDQQVVSSSTMAIYERLQAAAAIKSPG